MNREQAGYPLNARLFITIRFQAHINHPIGKLSDESNVSRKAHYLSLHNAAYTHVGNGVKRVIVPQKHQEKKTSNSQI